MHYFHSREATWETSPCDKQVSAIVQPKILLHIENALKMFLLLSSRKKQRTELIVDMCTASPQELSAPVNACEPVWSVASLFPIHTLQHSCRCNDTLLEEPGTFSDQTCFYSQHFGLELSSAGRFLLRIFFCSSVSMGIFAYLFLCVPLLIYEIAIT